MPYTLAHPGFVLPLQRKWPRIFDVSALTMGSIVPDFDIIFRFTETRFHIFDYSAYNIFFFIVPFSIIASIYLHLFFWPVINNEKHLLNFSAIQKIPFIPIIISSIVAVFFHLYIDGIFHPELISTRESILRVVHIQPENIWKLDFIIQYGPSILTTFIGFFIFLWYLWRPNNKQYLIQFIGWLTFRDIVFFMVSTGFFALFKILRNGWMSGYGIDLLAIAFTSGFIASSFLLPVYHFVISKKSNSSHFSTDLNE